MKQSPMFSGIVYILLGSLFTYFAIQNVNDTGWGFFSYLLVLLATFDFGSGIRMILFHFKLKQMQKK
ncbi:YdiK family protein [Bacillus sp. ISL-35]|uniref:YdiK family protein n=1 Tax=Bacillus sp. ISL-35 TaxID=2819122 RepID=UPI001BEC42ED|nr:YdiK family protein [Bacillus sp. ISL-35]MBT2681694.1 YdiK family protein [Bacillus sp. ISL-35]MBT2706307.1 YdiK family protein [Chryseobacterium sp. ISL-80]